MSDSKGAAKKHEPQMKRQGFMASCRELDMFAGSINPTPATAVIGIMAAVTSVASIVLNEHVLWTIDHRAVFVIGSYVVFSSYFVIYYFLEKYSSSFREVSPDKRFYTISNLIKSGMLAAITPFSIQGLYNIIVHDAWETIKIRNLGCLYAIPDFVSLLVVRRMQWTTIFHHICVCIFNYANVNNDYSQINACRLIVVYAIFSVFAYSVNMLLASRFLGFARHVSRFLSALALTIYVTCCAINWSWQVYYWVYLWDRSPWDWTLIAYACAIVPIVYDDLYLNRWLLFNFNRLSKPETPEEAAENAAAKKD